jgi:hypothetical protein
MHTIQDVFEACYLFWLDCGNLLTENGKISSMENPTEFIQDNAKSHEIECDALYTFLH